MVVKVVKVSFQDYLNAVEELILNGAGDPNWVLTASINNWEVYFDVAPTAYARGVVIENGGDFALVQGGLAEYDLERDRERLAQDWVNFLKKEWGGIQAFRQWIYDYLDKLREYYFPFEFEEEEIDFEVVD